MKSLKFILVGTIVLAAAAIHADIKSEWQKKLDTYCALFKKKDNKGMEAILKENFSPNFKFMPMKGQGKPMNLKEWIDAQRSQLKMMDKCSEFTIHIDKTFGGKNVFHMATTIHMVCTAKLDPKGKPGTIKSESMADQILLKEGDKWVVAAINVISDKMTFNGKPVKM